ncbi:MAG TPA: aminotransferase class I/II-fold pyridoxal phosphate-dependent enzyme, partial [Patescibacteria group bacterium]|nr:aminotransferase class I/II-fold pyridoxal phosphate-dependent enzyme [Patescibacteria group bacterium]
GGVKLKPVLTKLADNFQIPPLSVIKKAVTKKTKGIIITNPSNPTGSVYDPKLLSALVDFCVKKKLFIIADETYREFVYGKTKFRSLLTFKKAEQLVVSADSFSKRYSLCGARLGLLASKNKAVMEAANKLAQSRLAVATIDQMAASKLHLVPQSYFKKIKSEYVGRRDELMQGLSRIDGVTFSRPDGAFYLIAQLPVKNAENFCKFMLNKFNHHQETVMLAPAEGFYVTPGMGRNQVRIAYVLNRRDLKRACELIKLGLSTYSG